MKNEPATTNNLKQFGLMLGLILTAFGYIHFLKHHTSIYPLFIGFGVLSASLSMIAPGILRPVYKIFIKITHTISWLTTRAILTILYYLLITPIGLVLRLFGTDLLSKKIDKNADSYWITRNENTTIQDTLKKQF